MGKFIYTTYQGLHQFYDDWSRYVLILFQIFVAISMCYMMLTLVYSINLANKDLADGNLTNNWKVMSLFQRGIEPRFPYTPADIADIEEIFADNGTVYFIHHQEGIWHNRNPELREPNFVNLHIYYTSGLRTGEYIATAAVEELLFNEQYVYTGLPLPNSYIEKLQDIYLTEQPSPVSDDNFQFVLRHQVTPLYIRTIHELQENLPDALFFLPLEDYYLDRIYAEGDRSKLLVFFDDQDTNAHAIGQALNLLHQRYDGQIQFLTSSDISTYRQQIEGHQLIARIFMFLAVGIIIIAMIGLASLVTAIIKKRKSEICIRLCVGVSIKFVYWEILISLLAPLLIAAILGIKISNRILAKLDLVSVPIVSHSGIGIATFVLLLLIIFLAIFVPLLSIRKTNIVEVLKQE